MKSEKEIRERIKRLENELTNLQAEQLSTEDPMKQYRIGNKIKIHQVLIVGLHWVLGEKYDKI